MNKFVKKIFLLFISGLLFSSSQQAFAQSFQAICKGNGEVFNNVHLTSVIVMGAEYERRLFVYINGDTKGPAAIKNYNSSEISDIFLINSIINAKILNSKVDLCITGNTSELYGINIK